MYKIFLFQPIMMYHLKNLICKNCITTQSCKLINLTLLDVNNWHSNCGCFGAACWLLSNDEK